MPYKKLPIGGAHSEILSWANHDFSIEEQSMLRNVSRLPCLFKHVALMPDAHLGKGSMVGSVIATKEAVIPATVGVDIGCGMMAVKTPFKSGILDGKLKELNLAKQTAGVECRKDVGVLDEIPGAYKSIEAVMKNQEDLVQIVAEFKQVVCVKG